MNEHDMDAFQEIWTGAYAMYRQTVSATMLDLCFDALQSYSISDVSRGVTAHIRNPDTGHFPPKPADIIKHIRGNSQSASGEAWAKVDRAIRCVGHYRSVVFDDPKIHAAIERLGGWLKIAMTSEKEYPFLQRNFTTLYQGFTHQPPATYPRKLIGHTEHQNELAQGEFTRGSAKERPAMIGDPERCRVVYKGGGDQGVARIHHAGTQKFLESAISDSVNRIGRSA